MNNFLTTANVLLTFYKICSSMSSSDSSRIPSTSSTIEGVVKLTPKVRTDAGSRVVITSFEKETNGTFVAIKTQQHTSGWKFIEKTGKKVFNLVCGR